MDEIDKKAHTENIKIEDEIDVMIKNKSNSRGTLFLNGNEIKLYDFYPVLNQETLKNKIEEEKIGYTLWKNPNRQYKPTLNDIMPPYRLIKRKNNDTLKIFKYPDTILVLMKAPEYENDPSDPTFGEFFQQVFGKKQNKNE
ncbi:hypothetical protein [Sinomicrobium oceani]|nr:hypothetical protein [Sinomicrobium oceani]